MNRALMDGNPHSILEGFIIGAASEKGNSSFAGNIDKIQIFNQILTEDQRKTMASSGKDIGDINHYQCLP